MERLAELMVADPKSHEQMKASQALCTGLADILEVVLSKAVSNKAGALAAAAIDFLGSFCRYCIPDLLTLVLPPFPSAATTPYMQLVFSLIRAVVSVSAQACRLVHVDHVEEQP
jgi:hypothetical protein